jgi:hypothetical protein
VWLQLWLSAAKTIWLSAAVMFWVAAVLMDGRCGFVLLLQGFRKRHMNVLGPAVSPTVANGVVTQVSADCCCLAVVCGCLSAESSGVCREQWRLLCLGTL